MKNKPFLVCATETSLKHVLKGEVFPKDDPAVGVGSRMNTYHQVFPLHMYSGVMVTCVKCS